MSQVSEVTKPDTDAYFTTLSTEQRLFLLAGLIAGEIRKDVDASSPLLTQLVGDTNGSI